jgi:hypothetical protein
MFIASKYEDVFPLLMKTVIKKIGHGKITDEHVRAKELDIVKAINFLIGGLPTPLEFLDRYLVKVFENHEEKDFISRMSLYLAKMCMHHEKLCHRPPSQTAASCIYVALKICEQMRKKPILNKQILKDLIEVSAIDEKSLVTKAQ